MADAVPRRPLTPPATAPTTSSGPEPPHPEPASRTQRLDELPFTPQHRRLLAGAGIGWAFDAMDVGLVSFVLAALAREWALPATTLSWIASAGFAGMAIGASVGGLLADRFGRRQVFAVTLLVYGLATGASALAWSVGALLVFRFLTGLGLGAELPVASTLVSEFAPTRIRARTVVALEAFWAVGWLLAALIGFFVVPTGANGWRWALAIGALPALYAAVVRRGLPESVRFLERRGRVAEAEATTRRFEASAGLAPPSPSYAAPPPPASRPAPQPALSPLTLWAPGQRARTGSLWALWFAINFSYYGAFIWLPTLLVGQERSLVRGFGYALIITLAQLPGYAAAGVLVERWGRRPTLGLFLVGSAVSAALFGVAEGPLAVVGSGMLLSFFNLGAWGALYALTPEVYPTLLRATGAGWAAGFGRIASILAPLSVPPLRGIGGTGLVFGVFAAFFLLGAAALRWLPEQRGLPLPEQRDAERDPVAA